MKKLNLRSVILIGITLFSMFFGSGNLIFPPFLGYQSGSRALFAFLGFALSAVALPVLGVAAVAKCGGLDRLCERVHPRFALLFSIIIYLCIGPMLAIPRTASTSYSMFSFLTARLENQTIFSVPMTLSARILFSLVFFAAAGTIAKQPERLKDILGKRMTPLLLILIFALFAASLFHLPLTSSVTMAAYEKAPFLKGFTEGYQTMDTMAAMVFGIVIADNIRALGVQDNNAIAMETIKGGVIAGLFLGLVYGALTFLGVKSGGFIENPQNGTEILSALSREFFGTAGPVLLALIFFIACFNVCVGLICSCAKFFSEKFSAFTFDQWRWILTVWSFVISILGLDAIIAISSPVLSVIYPVAIVIIVLNLLPFAFLKKPLIQRAAVILALIFGFSSIWNIF